MRSCAGKLRHITTIIIYLNKPVITDFEFDLLLNELDTLEKLFPEFITEDSPTRRVGSDLTDEFIQYEHAYPMLSLGNTYNTEELKDFIDRVEKVAGGPAEYVCELKFDGASISITYRNKSLFRALTRGDGTAGDDVTRNVKTIRSIPLKISGDNIPEEFVIRGEILMPRSVFNRLNEERISAGLAPFANPRNAASGTLKLLDPKIVASRELDCMFYFLLSEKTPHRMHFKNLEEAGKWGFKVSEGISICRNMSEVVSFIDKWEDRSQKTGLRYRRCCD